LEAGDEHIIAVDLPGHGRSDKRRGDYSLGALASTLRDLLDHLDVSSATLVGHSLGGGIAMQFAYQFPQRTDRLVLVASGGLGEETFPLLRAATLPGSELVIRGLTHERTLGALDRLAGGLQTLRIRNDFVSDDTRTILRGLNESQARSAFLSTLRSVVDVSGQRVSAVDKLSAAAALPTLLIWGDRDPIIPVEHGQRAVELLPEGRLVVFLGAGHEPHRYDPVRFADLVLEFTGR
jgi:pimeloyl-ACP methyl ester carboxylesterase